MRFYQKQLHWVSSIPLNGSLKEFTPKRIKAFETMGEAKDFAHMTWTLDKDQKYIVETVDLQVFDPEQ